MKNQDPNYPIPPFPPNLEDYWLGKIDETHGTVWFGRGDDELYDGIPIQCLRNEQANVLAACMGTAWIELSSKTLDATFNGMGIMHEKASVFLFQGSRWRVWAQTKQTKEKPDGEDL